MAKVDPEQERAQLTDLYAHQTDEELEAAAAKAFELTEQARTILHAELRKRALDVPVLEYAPGDEAELRPLVRIRAFRDLPQALLAKGSLDSAGIECSLADDNIVRLDWFWSTGMGGVKLLVDPENVDAANEVLNQPIPPEFDAEGTGTFEQPRPEVRIAGYQLPRNFSGRLRHHNAVESSSSAASAGMALPLLLCRVGR